MALLWALFTAQSTLAHSHIYSPQFEGCYAKPGEAVQWQYFWGHPFDMLIDDAEPPKFFIFTPEEKKETLGPQEITLKDPASGQDRRAFTVEYTPLDWGTITCAWRARHISSLPNRNSGRTMSRSRCMS